ncbi:MAG: tetratricopeptide repeat protein [Hymenobacter sp.]|nr:MAG: tetratricopeptide repeat protein [Hymenobacter sp.]
MRLTEDDVLDIQCFVYFLFKGTIHPKLIGENYVFHLVRDLPQLENAFRLFTEALRQHPKGGRADNRAEEYLVACYVNKDREQARAMVAAVPNEQPNDVYAHFFQLAQHFIYNTFAEPIQDPEYLRDLDGLGVIAVPPFALWTNVVNASAPNEAAAYARALRRANDRVRSMYDGQEPAEPFQDWELEQEIY